MVLILNMSKLIFVRYFLVDKIYNKIILKKIFVLYLDYENELCIYFYL